MNLIRHLVIFARTPRRGQVKRRLAAGIGDGQATVFYRQTAHRTVRLLSRDRRWLTYLAVTPDLDMENGYRWPLGAAKIAQGQGGLGQRMARVMRRLPPGPVVIVGTDLPDISTTAIANAFSALGHADAVFGPAEDGGYWLVGLKRRPCIPDVFADVRWSSEHALADTLANFSSNHRIAQLETRRDIDDKTAYVLLKKSTR